MVFAIVVFSGSYNQVAFSESGLGMYDGMSKTISVLDKKKKSIVLGGRKFSYNSVTLILNNKGEKITADSLKKGDFVKIQLDVNQRFIGAPTLKSILIETGD